MANYDIQPNYVLKINQLETIPSADGLTNVVIKIYWNYEASYQNFTSVVSGSCLAPTPSSGNFIPYEELTQDIVTQWVYDVTDMSPYQQQCKEFIIAKMTPQTVILPLPW